MIRNFPEHKRTGVYLSPSGAAPINEVEFYEPMAYEFIVNSLERIISVYEESLNEQVQNYIKDYITTIKRNLMGTDESIKLVKKIYQNHQELMDFIIKHRPDVVGDLLKIIKEELLKRGRVLLEPEYKHQVLFLTPKINELVYYNKETRGWNEKASFSLIIELSPSTGNIIFRTTLAPTDRQYKRERLEDILCEIKDFKKFGGENWIDNFNQEEQFDYKNMYNMEDEEIGKLVNKFLDDITPTVKKIEEKFLKYKTELLKMIHEAEKSV